MQMPLPIFPENTKLINGSFGFFKKDDFIYYLAPSYLPPCGSKPLVQSVLDSHKYFLPYIIRPLAPPDLLQ